MRSHDGRIVILLDRKIRPLPIGAMGGANVRWCAGVLQGRFDMMVEKLRVAAVQMSSQDDVATNLARAADLVARARDLGADLVLLPENFAYFGPEDGKRAIAEPVGTEPR